MYDLVIRYLASVFFDADSITAKPEYTKGLLEKIQDDRFIPTPVMEDTGGELVNRIGFMIPNEGWTLTLVGKRCDFTVRASRLDGKIIKSFDAFRDEASAKLIAVMNYFDRKAHRIAIVREGFLPSMERPQLKSIAEKLFHFPPTFTETPPFEWDWRVASESVRPFANKEEPVNTLVTLKRTSGRMVIGKTETEFDRIRVDIDVNTSPKNVLERFGETEVNAFFHSAIKWQASLEEEVVAFLSLKEGVKSE